ncbi:MAG: coproporphyrinogen dehydrogenase HemZ [Clostridiales bacterium]|nr:coproporphyrinogen dehydrogenase HemZ [Clostridiales bacterium]
MYKFYFNRVKNKYELNELVRMFLPASEYELVDEEIYSADPDIKLINIPDEIEDKNEAKRYLFNVLKHYTGFKPDWGILTGVRPVKLAGEIIKETNSIQRTKEILMNDYYTTEAKADLILKTWGNQQKVIADLDKRAIAIYIGIPFCPTRCIYCSFPSNQADEEAIKDYLKALYKEIEYVSREVEKKGWYAESVYIGGGTPTILSDSDINELLIKLVSLLDTSKLKEFTVEAGRPDTITYNKLKIIKDFGVGRICINPQSMKESTLNRIGRNHKPADIVQAFEIAQKVGFDVINADLIAGLPGEKPKDFIDSLTEIIRLRPGNITVHTLAVKRASRLKEEDEEYSYNKGNTVRAMLDEGSSLLEDSGYRPYYLYRQKQMAGNFENVGYSLPGKECIFNIRTIEDNQTIIALGAGGISKIWFPEENRIERIPNVSNYKIYIDRIDEMIKRKRDGMFAIEEDV